jgi:hypothetical protein
MRRRWRKALVVLVAGAAAFVGTTAATFTSQTANTSNRVAAAPDFRAPTASASITVKSQTPGSSLGYIKQGGSYRVYATVSDTGNPASGTSTVTANVSAFSTGVTAAPLTAGSYTVGGVTYNYRSAILTASTPVAEGSKSYTLGLTDVAANSGTAAGYSVVLDNTAPAASDVQTTNSGTAGRATNGDKMIYTFSEPIDPDTIKSGWDGSSIAVWATVLDGGSGLLGLGLGAGNDDYAYNVVLVLRVVCDATFNSSTMAMSGSTVTVTLGGSAGCPRTSGAGTMTYAPAAGPTDRAGNALPTTQRNETGGNDADF